MLEKTAIFFGVNEQELVTRNIIDDWQEKCKRQPWDLVTYIIQRVFRNNETVDATPAAPQNFEGNLHKILAKNQNVKNGTGAVSFLIRRALCVRNIYYQVLMADNYKKTRIRNGTIPKPEEFAEVTQEIEDKLIKLDQKAVNKLD